MLLLLVVCLLESHVPHLATGSGSCLLASLALLECAEEPLDDPEVEETRFGADEPAICAWPAVAIDEPDADDDEEEEEEEDDDDDDDDDEPASADEDLGGRYCSTARPNDG
jgi:hypothetical protein